MLKVYFIVALTNEGLPNRTSSSFWYCYYTKILLL